MLLLIENILKNLLKMKSMQELIIWGCGQWILNFLGIIEGKINLYLSILRLTAFPFLSLWYVINIRGGDYADIFYTIMVTNWVMGIALLIFIGYFLNNVFKQNKTLFSY